MFISVVIPVYNRIQPLIRAIESVLCQNYKHYEIIVVDDGSTVDIENSLEPYLHLENIKYIKLEINKGVSTARNKGIICSAGDYIALLDSDDLWLPFKLNYQVKRIINNKNINISYTNEFWYKIDKFINKPKDFKGLSGHIYPYILDKCRVSPSTLLVNKKVFDKVGYFNETLRVCEDYEFCLRASLFFEFDYIDVKSIVKISDTDMQLSKNIEYIEYVRLKILLNFFKKYSYLMDIKYQYSTIKEIDRKFNIVKKGISKKI
ncbi:MAG: glycosyltransferase [Deferribacterota bacterium]|nr:glycosyltransferase [Deferribacterota bacterium]